MPCARCQTIPLSSDEPGNLLLTCAVRELMDKLTGFLEHQGLGGCVEDRVVRLPNTRLREFLVLVRDSGAFNRLEYQGISALRLDSGETLTFHAFTRARTLDRWLSLLDADALLDILEHRRFISWFQPILAADTGAVIGHEALLRGQRQDGSLMFPGEILSTAADNDLLFQVDRQARETALHSAAAQCLDGQIFINFIPTAIYDPVHCLQSTVGWAKNLGIAPDRIVFEVVETERVDDIEHLKRILDFYRTSGYRVALDDVGSGYASLNLLAQIRPDIIKVDMEIIRHIDTDPGRQTVFRALIGIARELDIQVLAEGIETPGELAHVVAEGADLLQGYLFARPAPEPPPPNGLEFWTKP